MDNSFFPQIKFEVPDFSELKNPVYAVAEENYASNFAEKILLRINEFDVQLDNQYEVALRLVNFGQTVTISVTSIGYSNPGLVIFNGINEDGLPMELIQHISQISFLITAIKRKQPDKPKKPIGFRKEE